MTVIRVLAGSLPDADWVAYARQQGATFVVGDDARRDCAADWEQEAARLVDEAPAGHGRYWKVSTGECNCPWCVEAWRQASRRYRYTGSYAPA